MKLCPECLERLAPDQRPQARDGRCRPCLNDLSRHHWRELRQIERYEDQAQWE